MTGSKQPSERHEATAFVIIGLLAIPLFTLAIAALVLPPGLSFSLVQRGVREGHWSWVALGTAVGLAWSTGLLLTGRSLFAGRAAATR